MSGLPPLITSSISGTTTVSTAGAVSTVPAWSITQARTSATVPGWNSPRRCPIVPIRPMTSGGSDSSAKNAASAASPVTR